MNHNIIVNESCATLRGLGRESLKGKWGFAALGTFIYLLIAAVPAGILTIFFGPEDGSTSGVASLYSLLVSGPLMLGYIMFAISIFRKRETSVAEVFYGFERFGKALGLYIVMSIFIILWTLLLVIPGIIASFRYSLAFYLLADNPDMGIMQALSESKRLMMGNKWKMFCLNLSFIGWALLCIPTFGIGVIWLLPYMQVSTVAFYDIVNGSLKAADKDVSEITGTSEADAKADPITVYKENADPELNAKEEVDAEPDAKEDADIEPNTEDDAGIEPNTEEPQNKE